MWLPLFAFVHLTKLHAHCVPLEWDVGRRQTLHLLLGADKLFSWRPHTFKIIFRMLKTFVHLQKAKKVLVCILNISDRQMLYVLK